MLTYAIKTSEPLGIPQSICTRTLRNLTRIHKVSAPEPSGTPPSIFSAKTLRNLTRSVHRNPPEPHHASSPRPSGTSSGSCTGNFRNLTRYLHRNPPEPHKVSAPEPSGVSRYLHQNPPPEPCRNQLHRIAQELIWAKDPIATFCC